MKAQDWKTSTFQPKTDAIIAAIKSGEVVLKSPEDLMCEEIDALKQRVKVLEEALGKIADGRESLTGMKPLSAADSRAIAKQTLHLAALAPPVGEKETL